MKPLLFAGLALALCAPAWAQPQPQDGPPAPPDGQMAPPDDGRPDDRGPGAGGPIQLQNPHRRGGGNGAMMEGGRGGGMMPFGEGGNRMAPPAPVMTPLPVSMFADERYLFILRGDTLMQFDKKSLTLLQSVELPRPVMRQADTDSPDAGPIRSRTSPPLLRRPDGGGANGAAF